MRTKNLSVFDPAMCCSTGVCGPEVDPQLLRFSADLAWLRGRGVTVERFNLAQEPGAFLATPLVKAALESMGASALPIVLLDGKLVMSAAYPTRDQLAGWTGTALESQAPPTGGCCGGSSAPKSTEAKTGCC